MKKLLLLFLVATGFFFLPSCSEEPVGTIPSLSDTESVVDDATIADPLAAVGSSNITFGIYAETVPVTVKWDTDTKMDIWNGMTVAEQTTYKGDGTKAWKFTGTGSWMGMGIRCNPLTSVRSLSSFSGGYLSFMFKGTKRFKVGIKSVGTTTVEKWIAMTNGAYGFYNNNVWCVVRIPLSVFSGIDLSKVQQYFMFSTDSSFGYTVGSVFYMDKVYWYKTVTYNTSSSSSKSSSISSSSSKSSSSSSSVLSSSSKSSSISSSISSASSSVDSNWGANWTRRTVTPSVAGLRWNDIAVSTNGNKIAAVSYGGYVYTSADGGATWTERTGAGTNYWMCVAMSADGNKIIVSGSSLTYTSSDGGSTWTKRTVPSSSFWNVAMSADGLKIAGVAYGTSVYVSSDGGSTWTERPVSGGPRYLKGVGMSSDGTRLAVTGTFGNVCTSSDSGATWTVRSGAGQSGSDIAISADGQKIIQVNYEVPYNSANSKSIFTSSNGGVSWTEQTGPGAIDWYSTAVSKDGTKMAAVSGAGNLAVSSDGGTTWVTRTAGTTGIQCVGIAGNGSRMAAGTGDVTALFTCP